MEVSENVFLETHYPMKFLVKKAVTREIEYDEENLISEILSPHTGNRIFFLIGDTGTGKSEFCLYLKYKVEKGKAALIPIHIPKYRLFLEKIISIIIDHLDEQDRKKYKKEFRVQRLSVDQAPNISNLIVSQVFIEPVPGLSEESKARINPSVAKRVEERVRRYLQTPLEGTEREPEAFTLMDEREFNDVLLSCNIKVKDLKLAYKYLREKLSKKFREYLQLPDLSELLEKISNDFDKRNLRPLLIVDDIVTLGPMVYDFIDFLSTLETGNWDAVIGVTPGKTELLEKPKEAYEEIKGMETLRERSTEIYLTHGQESTFLNINNCVDFICPYLQLIKNCQKCENREPCLSMDGDELYPFNRVFLERTFESSEKRTPREFVQLIKEMLLVTNEMQMPYQVTKQYSLYTPVTIRRRVCELNPQLADCALWYGEISKDKRSLVMKKSLLKLFRINDIPEEIVSIHDEQILVPIVPLPEQITKEVRLERPAEEEEEEERLIDVKKWLEGENVFPHKESLRRGVFEIMKRLRSFQTLRGPSLSRDAGAIIWDKQFQGLPIPIVIEGADEPPNHPHILITRHMLGDFAHSIAFLGHLYLKNSPDAETYLKRIITRLNADALNDLGKNFLNQVLENVEASLELPSGIRLENWILFSYVLSQSLLNGLGMPSFKDMQKDLLEEKKLTKQPWLSDYNLPKTVDFINSSKIYRRLFRSFFTFRKSTANYAKIKETFIVSDEMPLLSYIASIKGDNIPECYRVDSKTLKDIVSLASDAARELLNFDYSEDYNQKSQHLKDILESFHTLTVFDVDQFTKDLRSLHSISPVWLKRKIEGLIQTAEKNKVDLLSAEKFLQRVETTLNMQVSGPLTFFAFLHSFHDIRTHRIHQFLENLNSVFNEVEQLSITVSDIYETIKSTVSQIEKMQKELSAVA